MPHKRMRLPSGFGRLATTLLGGIIAMENCEGAQLKSVWKVKLKAERFSVE